MNETAPTTPCFPPKPDFAKLPIEYDLLGRLITNTEVRIWYLLESLSCHSIIGVRLDAESEEVILSGASVVQIIEEPHAVRIVVQGCNTERAGKALEERLARFLIPSVRLPNGNLLLDRKWLEAR